MDRNRSLPRAGDWDLASLAERLWTGRRRLLGCAVVALGIALLLVLLDRQRYRAEAILAVARPGTVLQFDPRFAPAGGASGEGTFRVNNLRAYSELLEAEGTAQRVAEALRESGYQGSLDHRDLLAAMRFRSLADGGLLKIEAAGTSPQEAALLAQTWAEVFSAQMQQVYAATGSAAVLAQRDQAAADLDTAAEALAKGYRATERDSLRQRWQALQAAQGGRLATRERLAAVAADLAAIAGAGGPVGEPGRLAGLRLGLAALSATGAVSDTLALELSLPAGTIDAAALSALDRQVALRTQSLQAAIAAGARDLDLAHEALARADLRLDALRRAHGLVEERYLTLARKADELAVAEAAQPPEVRLTGPAVASERLPWRDYALRLAAALAAGLALGALWALVAPSTRAGREIP